MMITSRKTREEVFGKCLSPGSNERVLLCDGIGKEHKTIRAYIIPYLIDLARGIGSNSILDQKPPTVVCNSIA